MPTIKLVSYTGKYPNLCSGVLTLEIDGTTTIFGGKNGYTPFWVSGGSCRFSKGWDEEIIKKGAWTMPNTYGIYKEDYQNKELYPELIRIFNENVPQGCCGGCL